MQANFQHHPLKKLFAGFVEHAFSVEVGLCAPRLTNYLVDMLLDFIHVDRLYKLRDAEGHRLESIAAMLAVLESLEPQANLSASAPQEREIHRHIGDFALFWTGLFPEGLRRRPVGLNPDHLVDYVGHGKESYAIASTLFGEDVDPPGSVFRHLSEEFELCAHGLGLVRRRWEEYGFEGPAVDPRLLY